MEGGRGGGKQTGRKTVRVEESMGWSEVAE